MQHNVIWGVTYRYQNHNNYCRFTKLEYRDERGTHVNETFSFFARMLRVRENPFELAITLNYSKRSLLRFQLVKCQTNLCPIPVYVTAADYSIVIVRQFSAT